MRVVAVGRIREGYLREGIAEYAKRLRSYTQFEEISVREEAYRENESDAVKARVMEREADALLHATPRTAYKIALDRRGRRYTSEAFAEHLAGLQAEGRQSVAFLIGGSLGLAPRLLGEVDESLSFSSFTFPHQLMRLILMEQIYRAFSILRGEPYHK